MRGKDAYFRPVGSLRGLDALKKETVLAALKDAEPRVRRADLWTHGELQALPKQPPASGCPARRVGHLAGGCGRVAH